MKQVVVISSSLRAQSTSRTLLGEAVKGAKQNHEVEVIDLNGFNLQFCKGCLACQRTGKCIINDDVQKVIEKVNHADILVFATPIYYYAMCGQLKTFLDRLNPLFVSKTRKFQEVYALYTCADDAVSAVEGARKEIEGWVACFNGVKLKEEFLGLGMGSVGDITEEVLQNAFRFGLEIGRE